MTIKFLTRRPTTIKFQALNPQFVNQGIGYYVQKDNKIENICINVVEFPRPIF